MNDIIFLKKNEDDIEKNYNNCHFKGVSYFS